MGVSRCGGAGCLPAAEVSDLEQMPQLAQIIKPAYSAESERAEAHTGFFIRTRQTTDDSP